MFSKADGPGVRGHKGTPMFMAPEMWQAKVRNIADRSICQADGTRDELDSMMAELIDDDSTLEGYALDVWALGVTFYMLLMGRPPYRNVEEVMTSGTIPPPAFTEPPQEIPTEWCTLIKRMLDPKPYKRPQISVVRNYVKKIDNILSQAAASKANRRGGVLLAIEEVATAFTPRYNPVNPIHAGSNPNMAAMKLSPSASRRSVAAGRNSFLQASNLQPSRSNSMDSEAMQKFTPVVPPLSMPLGRFPQFGQERPARDETPSYLGTAPNRMAVTMTMPHAHPDASMLSVAPPRGAAQENDAHLPTTHSLPFNAANAKAHILVSEPSITARQSPPPPLSPAPHAPEPPPTSKPNDASPKASILHDGGSDAADAATVPGAAAFSDDGVDRNSSRSERPSQLQSSSSQNHESVRSSSSRKLTFTNSRGELRPAIVIDEAEMFDI